MLLQVTMLELAALTTEALTEVVTELMVRYCKAGHDHDLVNSMHEVTYCTASLVLCLQTSFNGVLPGGSSHANAPEISEQGQSLQQSNTHADELADR